MVVMVQLIITNQIDFSDVSDFESVVPLEG
jgi:hypothetical protein